MPPRKKTRLSTTTSPRPTSTTKPTEPPTAPSPTPSELQAQADHRAITDPWTDEEEIGLFKGLIKWKPTGIHKHFHILSLQQYLLSNGYIHPRASHTRIPGIWEKLGELYDLEALDEREDAGGMPWSEGSDEGDEESEDGSQDEDEEHGGEEFELPNDDEFGELMWRQRFPKPEDEIQDSEESDAELEDLVARADSPPVRFTPSFEIATSEEKATPSRRGRGAATAGANSATATVAKAKARAGGRASAVSAATRRSSRVADSVDPEEEEEEDEDEEGSGEESGAASTASGTPAPRGRGRQAAAVAAAAAARNKPAKSRAKRKR